MFTWIVERINKQLEVKIIRASDSIVIGVLDIYGFEIFDNNRQVNLRSNMHVLVILCLGNYMETHILLRLPTFTPN